MNISININKYQAILLALSKLRIMYLIEILIYAKNIMFAFLISK